jgi:hypothetical protein
MKTLIFVGLIVLCATSALYAWTYTTQTTWNGSIHVTGSTSFTPSSTTAYVRMSAPENLNCPICDPDPGVYVQYTAKAKLTNGTITYAAARDCGGCATATGTVTTTQTWTLYAVLDETCQYSDVQQSSWGPVSAKASSIQENCNQTGPGQ